MRFWKLSLAALAAVLGLAVGPAHAGGDIARSYGVWRNPHDTVHLEIKDCGATTSGVVVWASPKAEADALRDAIKAEMLERDTEELTAGQYIVRWTSIISNRFDTTAFKKVMPDVYKAYTKAVSSRRFSISA